VERLTLEPLAARHLPELLALVDDPEVVRYTRVPDPMPDGWLKTWLARYEAGEHDGTCAGFAALDESGRFVGIALAPEIDRVAEQVELGYVVARWARGRGVAGAMLQQLTTWAFDVVGAQRIVLIVDVDNAASSRVAARAGYAREGVMRSLFIKEGVRRDAELWSRLPGDPGSRDPTG
jgi:RimJ/RimL family protein N-acetyltransferase